MNWREATLSQLYEIAFHDRECPVQYKFEALNEFRCRKEAQKAREYLDRLIGSKAE